MLQYLFLTFLLIAFGAGFFFLYVKPKRKIKQFGELARKAGYKVKVTPYNPLNYFVVTYMKQDDRSLKVFKHQLKNYDLIVGNLFTKLAILPNHPDILKDLFNQTSKIHKNPFFIDVYKLLAEGGMPLAQGQEWKRKRKIISSVFHFDFLNHMIPVIEAQTEQEMKKMDQKIKNGETINILHSCSRIFSSVIVKCFFGTDVNQYQIEGIPYCEFFIKFLNQICGYSQSFQRMVFGMTSYNLGLTKKARDLKKHIKVTHAIALQVIEKQLAKLKKGEITQKNLLTTLYENNMLSQTQVPEPNKYTKDEVIGEFFSFFGAGTDTTTNMVNLIFHYLSQKKDCLEKIKQQLEQVKGFQGQQKLKNMKWAEAVINQTLRLGGPAASLLPRVIVQKLSAGGIQIPENTSLSIFPIMNMYKEEYFEKPFQFMPERWLQNPNIPNYAYIPFSAGERNCIGQYLAKIESKIIIQKIVKKYDFKAKYPIRMHYDFAYATQHGQFQMQIKT